MADSSKLPVKDALRRSEILTEKDIPGASGS